MAEQNLKDDTRFLLGQIDAKVDLLLARDETTAKRITFLERKYWIAVGLGGAMLLLLGKSDLAAAFAHVFVG